MVNGESGGGRRVSDGERGIGGQKVANFFPSAGVFGGGDPLGNLPLEPLGTNAATTSDGVQRQGAVGHSEYPRPVQVHNPDGTPRDVPRTPGYNLAIIGAGLADDPRGLLIRE